MRDPRRDVFGWFDAPGQTAPAHDPGVEGGTCPACGRGLCRPVVTVSLMVVGGARSYFFRAHKGCWSGLTESDRAGIESALIDTLATEGLEAIGESKAAPLRPSPGPFGGPGVGPVSGPPAWAGPGGGGK